MAKKWDGAKQDGAKDNAGDTLGKSLSSSLSGRRVELMGTTAVSGMNVERNGSSKPESTEERRARLDANHKRARAKQVKASLDSLEHHLHLWPFDLSFVFDGVTKRESHIQEFDNKGDREMYSKMWAMYDRLQARRAWEHAARKQREAQEEQRKAEEKRARWRRFRTRQRHIELTNEKEKKGMT